MINPSFLFPQWKGRMETWKKITCDFPRTYFHYCCPCNPYVRMSLTPNKFRHPKQDTCVLFFTGQCDTCGTIFWDCDKWDWTSWMTDRDMLETTLISMEVKFVTYNDKIIQIYDDRCLRETPSLNFHFDTEGNCNSQRIE